MATGTGPTRSERLAHHPSSEATARLKAALDECLREAHARRRGGDTRVALSAPTYDADDIALAVQTLVDGWPTIGPMVVDVETRLAEYLGVPHVVMVASGGAANLLLALYLASPHAPPGTQVRAGDEVIVPAVGWTTTVTPFLATGCVPVFADAEPTGLNIDVGALAELVTPRTRAVVAVHCLGHACDLDALTAFCSERGLLLIEDCCEAIGTVWRGRHVGTFGEFATFSFYFSHHLCAVEGGLIVTSDSEAAAVLRSMRANGYPSGVHGRPDNAFAAGGLYAEAGAATFPFTGFNFKPTDFSAALLVGQLERLEDYVAVRNRIADGYRNGLTAWDAYFESSASDARCRPSPMAFPIVVRPAAGVGRSAVCRYLNERGIDTRPVIGGNIATQPFVRFHGHRCGPLARAKVIQNDGFMIGIHHALTDAHVACVTAAFAELAASAGPSVRRHLAARQ